MILVTGGSGHLGRAVIAALAAAGSELISVTRRGPEGRVPPANSGEPVAALRWDLSDPSPGSEVRRALLSAEAVVHLAAHVPETTGANLHEDALATLRSNVAGTVNLLRILSGSSSLRRFVYASTFEVYGPPRALPIREDHPTRPVTYYGASKLAGEKYSAIFAADREVPSCVLRMPAVYGPGDTKRRAIGNFIRAAADEEDLVVQGDGADRRDIVFADDAADAVRAALRSHASGCFNLGTGRGYAILEMANAVLGVTGSRSRIVFTDRVKERADVALDASAARERLGWVPRTSLEEGIRVQWLWVRGLEAPGGD